MRVDGGFFIVEVKEHKKLLSEPDEKLIKETQRLDEYVITLIAKREPLADEERDVINVGYSRITILHKGAKPKIRRKIRKQYKNKLN